MNLITITAVDIPDAWFQCVYELVTGDHRRYIIQQGSNVGQTRLEFDYITVMITHPYAEPYDAMLPKIPAHIGLPDPVPLGYVEQYMPYLMTDTIQPNEDYTYGSRILQTLDPLIERLKETPDTNQAILQIARPKDFFLVDPPCLRHIDVRVWERNGVKELVFYLYFRSWDLWGGFPANLAGIAVMQKYVADLIGCAAGPIVAASKGLHLYGYAEDLARMRAMRSE